MLVFWTIFGCGLCSNLWCPVQFQLDVCGNWLTASGHKLDMPQSLGASLWHHGREYHVTATVLIGFCRFVLVEPDEESFCKSCFSLSLVHWQMSRSHGCCCPTQALGRAWLLRYLGRGLWCKPRWNQAGLQDIGLVEFCSAKDGVALKIGCCNCSQREIRDMLPFTAYQCLSSYFPWKLRCSVPSILDILGQTQFLVWFVCNANLCWLIRHF